MKEKVQLSAYERNNLLAAENRKKLSDRGVFTCNIIGSPGCGKTSLLETTARRFGESFAVIVGDVKTALDSDRLLRTGHRHAYAIETGGGCHLTASQIENKLEQINLAEVNYLFIENVGNLVCPAAYELGENLKVAVLSVPEGDEKVRKYPKLFIHASVVIINKVDLLEVMDYDIKRVREDCRILNPAVKIFETSAKTGSGLDSWFDFLKEQRRNL